MTQNGQTSPANDAPDHRQLHAVLRVLALAELLLLSVTWRLWWAGAGNGFPTVSLIRFLPMWDWLDHAALLALGLGLVGILLPSGAGDIATLRRGRTLFVCGSAAFLVIPDLHRLQVWHWLFLLCTAQTVLLPSRLALVSIRLTAAGIYVFSALSRLSLETPDEITAFLIRKLMQLGGPGIPLVDQTELIRLSVIGIGFELLTGVLLLLPRTRRLAVRCSFVVHTLLLVALGPLGLGHRPAVLIWNAMFLILNPVLFRAVGSPVSLRELFTRSRRLERATFVCICGFVVLFPLSGLFGFSDNWPSWQVYSRRPEVWRMFVVKAEIENLPSDVQRFCENGSRDPLWAAVRIDRWSLEATGTPLYPEDRFQVAVIEYLSRGLRDDSAVHVVAEEPKRFWWRGSHERRIQGRSELLTEQRRFHLNASVSVE